MGFWKSARGINGDGWADEMGRCMKALEKDIVPAGSKTYGEKTHEITLNEFADLVEFCARGHIVADVNDLADGNLPLSKLFDAGEDTYPNRGQMVCD